MYIFLAETNSGKPQYSAAAGVDFPQFYIDILSTTCVHHPVLIRGWRALAPRGKKTARCWGSALPSHSLWKQILSSPTRILVSTRMEKWVDVESAKGKGPEGNGIDIDKPPRVPARDRRAPLLSFAFLFSLLVLMLERLVSEEKFGLCFHIIDRIQLFRFISPLQSDFAVGFFDRLLLQIHVDCFTFFAVVLLLLSLSL